MQRFFCYDSHAGGAGERRFKSFKGLRVFINGERNLRGAPPDVPGRDLRRAERTVRVQLLVLPVQHLRGRGKKERRSRSDEK